MSEDTPDRDTRGVPSVETRRNSGFPVSPNAKSWPPVTSLSIRSTATPDGYSTTESDHPQDSEAVQITAHSRKDGFDVTLDIYEAFLGGC